MNKKINFIILFLCLTIITLSCKKFVDLSVPQDRIVASRVFESDEKALSAVTGIYGNMINGSPSYANSLTTIYAGLSSDELIKFNPSINEEEFQTNSINPNNAILTSLWRSAFQSIYYSNAVLEGLDNSNKINPVLKEQLLGECKFIRAFSYFYLINFFGEVPLITKTDYQINQSLPRVALSEIYTLMIKDATEAKNSLPDTYLGKGNSRPTKFAAASLLARIYLYNKQWEKADAESTEIIESDLFTPLIPLNEVFLKNSKEAIWHLSPINGQLKEAQLIRPTGSPLTPKLYLSKSFISKFEQDDNRTLVWIDSLTYQDQKFYYPVKYKNAQTLVAEYYVVFRVSEIILIRAEARFNKGNYTEAIDDINVIRSRAGLQNLISSLSPSEINEAIQQERQSELFAEWGHRWFDLKRWNIASSILTPIKNDWQSTDVLYPIPEGEILANQFLTQNAGY